MVRKSKQCNMLARKVVKLLSKTWKITLNISYRTEIFLRTRLRKILNWHLKQYNCFSKIVHMKKLKLVKNYDTIFIHKVCRRIMSLTRRR